MLQTCNLSFEVLPGLPLNTLEELFRVVASKPFLSLVKSTLDLALETHRETEPLKVIVGQVGQIFHCLDIFLCKPDDRLGEILPGGFRDASDELSGALALHLTA